MIINYVRIVKLFVSIKTSIDIPPFAPQGPPFINMD